MGDKEKQMISTGDYSSKCEDRVNVEGNVYKAHPAGASQIREGFLDAKI